MKVLAAIVIVGWIATAVALASQDEQGGKRNVGGWPIAALWLANIALALWVLAS